ncbi:CPBP family intramembrane glutamic endopeptidase [Bacillus thermotolerans]|uniref:CAAX prenyl protease 2/Lysostaphin resistance protein A-like domain-containing protein n=1 Tax=Bacillus thermotolerans TaxID=1221996 RepID=A0A0F5HS62_BACTR|nr:type II CAAX endopeptidase family protein [Bacillus thermotolerans]KKB35564.1 hypothetical protein QY95_03417 [Bacillus thermotolerans]KKB36088.1 hypothetical protein QY97_01356 [Bacillus thermotolerans]
MNTTLLQNIISLCAFAVLIVSIQLDNYLLIGLWMLISVFLFAAFDRSAKSFVVTNLLFGVGFFAYLYVTDHWIASFHSKEWHVFLNRLSLIFILIPLLVSSFLFKVPYRSYFKKTQWKERIYFPFIWSGFHWTTVRTFLFIALAINIVAFLPIMALNGWTFIKEVWVLALIFSITNGILEEIIWRGALLGQFSAQLGEKWGVIVTSLGFGLQHYHLGMPWLLCIALSLGGVFYGGVTVKSKSILPSTIWHIALNVLMVLSGLLLN